MVILIKLMSIDWLSLFLFLSLSSLALPPLCPIMFLGLGFLSRLYPSFSSAKLE